MYNLPVETLETGRDQFWVVVRQHFQEKPVDILEIGVFQGKCIQTFPKDWQFKSYTGVDPYLGTRDDSYTDGYWKNTTDSDEVYHYTKKIFEQANAELVRSTSNEYFHSTDKQYDFIFVDADHRYQSALWDMCKWFSRVKEGGIMMVDDYGNTDTRGVTKAVNSFFAIAKQHIGRMGFFDKSFINTNKYIPVVSRYVFFEKKHGGLEKFSFNNGSSARDVPIEWRKTKKAALLSARGVHLSPTVLDLCHDYINDIVDLSNSLSGADWTGWNIWKMEDDARLSDWFLFIPHLGTLELERTLKEQGLKPAADFFTLSFPKNEVQDVCERILP